MRNGGDFIMIKFTTNKRQLKAGFIGCGAGLLAKAMEDAGIEVSWGIDINKLYLESFKLNFPKAKAILKDVREVKKFPEADVWAITLPCQSFSHANQKRQEKPELLYYSLYLIEKHKPKFWFIENVPNAGKYMPKIADVKYVRMCQFGNKQKRERMIYANFSLGLLRDGKHSVPAVTRAGTGNNKFYERIDWKEALKRMGFEGKGLKLVGNNSQKLSQLGEGVVYEFGYYIGKRLLDVSKNY